MAAKSVVLLQGTANQDEALVANATVKPGYLLLRNTDGTVRPHNAAAATALAVLVAVERTEIGAGIDEVIPIGDTCKYIRPAEGVKLTMWLKSAETTTIGGRLESAGDGTLQVATTGKAPFSAAEVLTGTGPQKIQVFVVEA